MDVVSEGIPGHYGVILGSGWHNQVVLGKPNKSNKEELQANNPIQPITTNPTCSTNVGYYLQSFSENASISGLKFLGENGRTLPERIFWALNLAVALVLSVILIVENYDKWITSPVIVTFATTETSIQQVPFPAITICPEIKSTKSLFDYTAVYLKKKKGITLTAEESKSFEFMSVVCTNPVEQLADENITTLPSEELFAFLSKVTPDFQDSEPVFYWNGNESDTQIEFSRILTSEGICYTFNMLDRSELFTDIVYYEDNYFSTNGKLTQWSPETGYAADSTIDSYPRRTLIAGGEGGLSIMLTVLKSDFEYACGDAVQGFKVTLHKPTEFPRVKQNYFRIPLDHSVVAAVKPNIVTASEDLRSYHPQHRKCYFSDERQLLYFKIYNQENCLIECLVNYTRQLCDCVNFYLPRTESMPICSAAKQKCMSKAKTMFLNNEIDNEIKKAAKLKLTRSDLNSATVDSSKQCYCLPSCYSLDFDVEISQANWDWEETFKIYMKTDNEFPDVEEPSFRASRLTIYFKNMQFVTSERNELYSYSDFWANVGGILGFFTGFSFITMFEVFYYLTLRLFCNIKMFGPHVWSGAPEL